MWVHTDGVCVCLCVWCGTCSALMLFVSFVILSLSMSQAQDPQMLDQLSKNITRCGLSNSTLNYLRVCDPHLQNLCHEAAFHIFLFFLSWYCRTFSHVPSLSLSWSVFVNAAMFSWLRIQCTFYSENIWFYLGSCKLDSNFSCPEDVWDTCKSHVIGVTCPICQCWPSTEAVLQHALHTGHV